MRPGDVFWEAMPVWRGRAVFCLASGPSLADTDFGLLRDAQRRGAIMLAVNSSVDTCRESGLEPDALIFTDTGWYENNRGLILGFPGLVFTFSRRAKADLGPRVMRVQNEHKAEFSVGSGPMKDGRSSGHRAVSLAILGAGNPVGMLGYDMKAADDGRTHCHRRYTHITNGETLREFRDGFDGWAAAATRAGVTVVNATPGSALTEFPMVDLVEFVGGIACAA